MACEITQRELRNQSGEIMRALDRGESFVVTRNGVPVGELTPLRHEQFVAAGNRGGRIRRRADD
jgi:prevent-host-death family protein